MSVDDEQHVHISRNYSSIFSSPAWLKNNLRDGNKPGAHTIKKFLLMARVSPTLRQTCSQPKPRAQYAFKDLMIHGILQFTLRITFRCVLHRYESQDIRCWELSLVFIYLSHGHVHKKIMPHFRVTNKIIFVLAKKVRQRRLKRINIGDDDNKSSTCRFIAKANKCLQGRPTCIKLIFPMEKNLLLSLYLFY